MVFSPQESNSFREKKKKPFRTLFFLYSTGIFPSRRQKVCTVATEQPSDRARRMLPPHGSPSAPGADIFGPRWLNRFRPKPTNYFCDNVIRIEIETHNRENQKKNPRLQTAKKYIQQKPNEINVRLARANNLSDRASGRGTGGTSANTLYSFSVNILCYAIIMFGCRFRCTDYSIRAIRRGDAQFYNVLSICAVATLRTTKKPLVYHFVRTSYRYFLTTTAKNNNINNNKRKKKKKPISERRRFRHRPRSSPPATPLPTPVGFTELSTSSPCRIHYQCRVK